MNPVLARVFGEPVPSFFVFVALAYLLAAVVFVDSGTVNNDEWLNQYRVGVGGGLRIYVPQFGQAPIALDFAYPIVKQALDEEQIFSFTIDLPF